MPIEIRELVIRATVGAADSGSGCGTPSSGAARSPSRPPAQADDDVVQTCVREVLRILDDKRER
jgi:Family of unknown function (DUF5908)